MLLLLGLNTFSRAPRGLPGLRSAAAILFLAVALALPSVARAGYASIVIDDTTGRVLHEVNADTRNYPASLTKMMTLYMVFDALERGELKMDQKLTVSRHAAAVAPSKLGLLPGQTITVEDAILALITKSANDVAVVVAEALAGSERRFGHEMTSKAKEIGMTRSNFRNASGLPNRHQLSTARDMATLARALIHDFPQYYSLFSTRKFSYEGRSYRNHNRLLGRYDGTDGIKTGYIRASGFNLVASVVRDGRRLVAVVFGGKTARSRDRHIARLLDRGFAVAMASGVKSVPEPPRRKPDIMLASLEPLPTDAALAPSADSEIDDGPVEMGSAEDLTPDNIWGVQVGAFYQPERSRQRAREAAHRVPDLLDGSRIVITDIRGQRGRIYRARLAGLTEEQARSACKQLKADKFDCLVVQVGINMAQRSPVVSLATN